MMSHFESFDVTENQTTEHAPNECDVKGSENTTKTIVMGFQMFETAQKHHTTIVRDTNVSVHMINRPSQKWM